MAGVNRLVQRLLPASLPAQMIAVLAGSFLVLLALLAGLEIADQGNLLGSVAHESTIRRLRLMRHALEYAPPARRPALIDAASRCHEGYSISATPFARQNADALRTRDALARQMQLPPHDLAVGREMLTRRDFSYSECGAGEIDFPVNGLVIAIRLSDGAWLNAEIHPHEWHIHSDLLTWLLRSGAIFLVVGAAALIFVHRLSRPLARLTSAAERFGSGLEVSAVQESGPSDLRRAIAAFNKMQGQVATEVRRRAHMLAAISHDLRSPLTALRIKAELVEDAQARADLVASIDRMNRMTTSVLEFLKGDSRNEPLRSIDLAALLGHECEAARGLELLASYEGPETFLFSGRPEALARAVRNLIENANKYATGAEVTLTHDADHVEIAIADRGPGVQPEEIRRMIEPFERLSSARESGRGGFGLGLSIVRAVCEGHDGKIDLRANVPTGLIAVMRLRRMQ